MLPGRAGSDPRAGVVIPGCAGSARCYPSSGPTADPGMRGTPGASLVAELEGLRSQDASWFPGVAAHVTIVDLSLGLHFTKSLT